MTGSSGKGNTFVGKQQPSRSRAPEIPDVNYAKGGDDFRVVERTSSFGRQIQSTRHAAGAVPIAKGQRFLPSDSYGPGPLLMGQMSCMGKQRLSTRRSYGSITFGTSTRDGAKRLYTLGNSKAH